MKIPPHLPVTIGDAKGLAFFDYDRGEEQWFDARAGVGNPGYPASVSINEIHFFGETILPETLSEETLQRMEQEIIDQIVELEREDGCDAPEAL